MSSTCVFDCPIGSCVMVESDRPDCAVAKRLGEGAASSAHGTWRFEDAGDFLRVRLNSLHVVEFTVFSTKWTPVFFGRKQTHRI